MSNSPFNEIFYASVKLVSGEELLSSVCAFEEDDKILVVLDYPIILEFLQLPNSYVPFAKIHPWLNLTDQTTFILDVNKIISMTEIHDEVLINIHKRYVKDRTKENNKTSLTKRMGYVASVSEARKKLEEIFNQGSPNSSSEGI